VKHFLTIVAKFFLF